MDTPVPSIRKERYHTTTITVDQPSSNASAPKPASFSTPSVDLHAWVSSHKTEDLMDEHVLATFRVC